MNIYASSFFFFFFFSKMNHFFLWNSSIEPNIIHGKFLIFFGTIQCFLLFELIILLKLRYFVIYRLLLEVKRNQNDFYYWENKLIISISTPLNLSIDIHICISMNLILDLKRLLMEAMRPKVYARYQPIWRSVWLDWTISHRKMINFQMFPFQPKTSKT